MSYRFRRSRRTSLDDAVYPGALIIGVVFGWVVARESDAETVAWPGTAIQVLATLLIALAIERDTLPARSRPLPALAAAVIGLATLAASALAVYHAGEGSAMSAPWSGLVAGTMAALLGLLFAGFVAHVGRSTADDHDANGRDVRQTPPI